MPIFLATLRDLMHYTVVVTMFNCQDSLRKVLDGIQSLAPPPSEVIFVDDASSDDSVKIVLGFQSNLANVYLIQNDANMGQSYSRNLGVNKASNPYIVFMDDDDYSCPDRAEIHLAALASGADFSYVSSMKIYQGEYFLNARNDDFRSSSDSVTPLIKHLTTNARFKDFKNIYAPSCTLAVQKKSFGNINGFREDMRRLEDIELACRALTKGLILDWSSSIAVKRNDTGGSDKTAKANFAGELAVLESVKEIIGDREYFIAKQMAIFRMYYFQHDWSKIFLKSFLLLFIIFLYPPKILSIIRRVMHDFAQRF